MAKANKDLARYVRMIREMHDRGFTVDVVVELALSGKKSQRIPDAEEQAMIRELYVEALPKGLRL